MNENLLKLIEVNKFDLEVAKFNPIIERKKAPIYEKENEKLRCEKEKQDLIALVKEKQDLIAKNTAALDSLGLDLSRIREKIEENKSEKEAKNLSMEEDLLNEKVTVYNNEIASLESAIAQSKERIESLDQTIKELDIAIEKLTEDSKADIEAIKDQQSDVSIRRQTLAMAMDSSALRLYEKIRKWAGNTSVISIYKNACGGCFIKLSDKSISDVRKGAEIAHCPHCGRILYDSDMLEYAMQNNKEKAKAAK